MNFYEYIGAQFAHPRGVAGDLCCLIMNLMNRAMYVRVADSLPLHKEAVVLDIGCGNGYLIRRMYQASKGTFYGLDVSEDALKTTGRRNQQGIAAKRIHLGLGDCCAMPFAHDFFDAVTSVNTIYFWSDPQKGFAEIHRVLKKGGVFSNAFYSKSFLQRLKYTRKGFRYFDPQEIETLAKQAGFTQVTTQTVSRGRGFIIICQKESP